MHYSVLATIDGSVKEDAIEEAIEKLFAPFSEHIEVEPYAIDPATHKWHDTWEDTLEKAKSWYKREGDSSGEANPDTFTDLDWLRWYSGEDWQADGKGGYVEMSTYNPISKWDYWIIGGRWDGYLNQVPNGHEDHPVWGKLPQYKDGKNILRRRDLRRPQSTYSYVTKDGQWFDKPDLPDEVNARYDRAEWQAADEARNNEWDKTIAEYLLTVPGEDWLVVVDIHM